MFELMLLEQKGWDMNNAHRPYSNWLSSHWSYGMDESPHAYFALDGYNHKHQSSAITSP